MSAINSYENNPKWTLHSFEKALLHLNDLKALCPFREASHMSMYGFLSPHSFLFLV